MLKINPQKESEKIVSFIRKTLKDQGFKKVIIAVSGGVDSVTSLLLLTKAIDLNNILVLKLPYDNQDMSLADKVIEQFFLPDKNVIEVNIKPMVSNFPCPKNRLRLGNIMARVRMIVLYDLAKKHQALVCGTENKSESLLGYFTRYGDQAADFEPISHLYKTEVYQLAKHLKIPQVVIDQPPSAGFWANQTDEAELGFTYTEADQVLYLFLEKKLSLKEIEDQGFQKAKLIIERLNKNRFKHQVPYSLKIS